MFRAPASAHGTEERLRHQGTGEEEEAWTEVEEADRGARVGRRGSGRWPGTDEPLKVIHSNVATVLGPLVPVFIRIQRNGKDEGNLFYT